jgi:hypothetical protein
LIAIADLKQAALEILLHNLKGPYQGLPRTAGWGYPEPYTRDWMIAALGILVTKNEELMAGLQHLLTTLANHQTSLGHIPSLAHNPAERGASDTTPLFLIAVALYRSVTGKANFLEEAVQKALTWLEYQSPDGYGLVAQLPTSDWRDEQWILGYGLYVNTLVYACARLYGREERARSLQTLFNQAGLRQVEERNFIHEGMALEGKPYYALWVYKIHASDRFDLLGNSLAILFGLASKKKADEIIHWVEAACEEMQTNGELACPLPPCLIPFIYPQDEDWMPRYQQFNRPGEYHNGGIWPFIIGFYIAALVAAGQAELANQKFSALSDLVVAARSNHWVFGFNEWFHAQDCRAGGQDWQTWSAAMYLFAAACVDQNQVPLFPAWSQYSD